MSYQNRALVESFSNFWTLLPASYILPIPPPPPVIIVVVVIVNIIILSVSYLFNRFVKLSTGAWAGPAAGEST